MIIEINKDIDRYQESVALGLTARQLIFSVASVAVGGGLVLLLYRYIGLTASAYVAIPCVAPIALQGFYSFNGMTFSNGAAPIVVTELGITKDVRLVHP